MAHMTGNERARQRTGGPAAGEEAEAGSDIDGVRLVLPLEVLVPDEGGEVVLFDDSGLGTVVLETDRPVVERGRVGRHRTRGGEDVSGWNFLRFEGGPVLYHRPEVKVVVVPPGRGGPRS